MVPWVLIDSASVPGGTHQLRLMQRGDEFSIRLGSTELMNTRLFGSEEALAVLTAARLRDLSAPDVLIGGLGMGFTLRAALTAFSERAHITVAELVPGVIAWAKGPLGSVFGNCLSDPRVTLVEGDVRLLIAVAEPRFDAILLDVDNGPEGLTRSRNDALYDQRGLRKAFFALRPGGVLGVWSAGPDPGFLRRLGEAGFNVEEQRVRATGKSRGGHHVLWLATKP
jgi:spermidine synthase